MSLLASHFLAGAVLSCAMPIGLLIARRPLYWARLLRRRSAGPTDGAARRRARSCRAVLIRRARSSSGLRSRPAPSHCSRRRPAGRGARARREPLLRRRLCRLPVVRCTAVTVRWILGDTVALVAFCAAPSAVGSFGVVYLSRRCARSRCALPRATRCSTSRRSSWRPRSTRAFSRRAPIRLVPVPRSVHLLAERLADVPVTAINVGHNNSWRATRRPTREVLRWQVVLHRFVQQSGIPVRSASLQRPCCAFAQLAAGLFSLRPAAASPAGRRRRARRRIP